MPETTEKFTILAVDDTPENLDVVKGILSADYIVKAATSGPMALKIAEKQSPDLILLDIVFPEDAQAGFKAAREIARQEDLQRIPVLILSAVNQLSNLGFSFNENDISNDFMPVKGFIEKPVEPSVLLTKIQSLL